MGTDEVNGTNGVGQYTGTVSHLQATAPGAFTVTQNTVLGSMAPTPEMLFDAMDSGGMISMTLGKYQKNDFGQWERKSGHIVALHRVENGCSNSPELGWRDPSTKDESKTQQADFESRKSYMGFI